MALTLKELMAIHMGNIEDAWSSSDSTEEKKIAIETPEVKGVGWDDLEARRKYKEKYGHDMPREHHGW
jgi:hypothetical protein